jgi:transmembrane sensor
MSERETSEAIEDRAAQWVARIDRSGGDPSAEAELALWLAGDDRRRGAYFRAQSAWHMLDRASVLRGGRPIEEIEAAEHAEAAKLSGWLSRRQMFLGGAAAAAAVAVVAAGITLWPDRAERIETAVGEIRRVPLKDGSMMAVNTATRLAVDLRPEIRKVAIDEGEAWFQVAHDRARPFVVEAGPVRVQAVGTAFSVRRMPNGADVLVTEGVVEVWSVGDEANRRRLAAGSRTFVGDNSGPQQVADTHADVDRTLAWRSGQLIFDGDTLGQAAAEFNRYNNVQVRIDDPALSGERFVGRFRTNEPEAFVRAAATILDAHAEYGRDEIRLSRN